MRPEICPSCEEHGVIPLQKSVSFHSHPLRFNHHTRILPIEPETCPLWQSNSVADLVSFHLSHSPQFNYFFIKNDRFNEHTRVLSAPVPSNRVSRRDSSPFHNCNEAHWSPYLNRNLQSHSVEGAFSLCGRPAQSFPISESRTQIRSSTDEFFAIQMFRMETPLQFTVSLIPTQFVHQRGRRSTKGSSRESERNWCYIELDPDGHLLMFMTFETNWFYHFWISYDLKI
jgi:hypothetical protein